MKNTMKTILEKIKGWFTAAKTLCITLWTKFKAWKYHLYALWGGAAVVVIAVGVVIALCLAGPNTNNPSISGTDPTGTVATAPDGTPITNPTTPDGTPVTTPDGGNSGENGGGNNGGGSNNGNGGNSGNTGNTKPPVGNTDDENTNSDAPPAPEGTADQMKNVVAVKTASAGGTITVHPGGRIIYTISITNNNSAAIGVTVTDTLPEGTVLVGGCSNISGNTLTWKVNSIDAGKTHEIKYAVKPNYTVEQVRDAKTDIILKNTGAKVMDNAIAAPGKDIWVLPTFNDTDCYRMKMAIDALTHANLTAKNSSNKPCNGLTLLSTTYNVGFSASSGFDTDDPNVVLTNAFEKGTYKSVVPTLYGGTKVPTSADSNFRGNRAASVTTDDLICGDVIIVNNGNTTRNYIFDGAYLVEATTTAVITNIDPKSVLQGLPTSDKYVVCRPSFNIPTSFSLENDEYFNDYDKQEYTELENAIIKTAESYLLRGDRIQYSDDYCGYGIPRYEISAKYPEDCTTDQYFYTNCASFTHDVHWTTYNYKAKSTQADGSVKPLHSCTFQLNSAAYGYSASKPTGNNASTIFYYECPLTTDSAGTKVSTLTDAEKEAIYRQYISLLRPGDIVVYEYASGGSGHSMLYVGNGLLIHSTGNSYSSTNKTDTHEASIRFMNVDDLFDISVNARRYLFNTKRFAIVRLQNLTTPKITENTKNRIAYMQGVVAEKVASTAMGKTVNPGDGITYTFYIFNTNNEAKNFQIKDTLSEHVTFVSATDGGKCSGSEISWNFSVPANTRVSVSYTVKVKDGVAAYTAIDGSKATINGVTHKCQDTYVANTLTAAQQQTLVTAVNTVKQSGISGMNSVQVANKIYKTAFGVDNLFGDNVTDLNQLIGNIADTSDGDNVGVFNDTTYYSKAGYVCMMDSNTSKASMMVAPGMYGGSYVYESTKSGETYIRYQNVSNQTLRSRYYWEKDLVVGDLFFLKSSSYNYLFIYIGSNTLVNLSNMTESDATAWLQRAPDSGWRYHAILRPSMVWENI